MNPEGKKPEPKAVEKDEELNLDALDRVSAGTNSSVKDAIKKVMEQQAEISRATKIVG